MSEAWNTDPNAAFAEAEARIATLIAEDGEVLDLSDLPALERLPDLTGAVTLREAYLGYYNQEGTYRSGSRRLADVGLLRSATALKVLDLGGTQVSDIGVLSSLTGLTSLDLSDTPVTDVGVLSSLTGLASLDLSGTPVTDFDVLSGLTGLTLLRLSRTEVSDIGFLSGLTGLTSLSLSITRVSDISFILDLPAFATERAEGLSYHQTPAAKVDSRFDKLSRLDPEACARETAQYLKGTHPDFRPPDTLVKTRLPADRLADAAPVDLVEADGMLDAVNPSPPMRLAPNEKGQRIETLRRLTVRLTTMAQRAQLSQDDKDSLAGYAAALDAVEPTWITLQADMAFLRAAPQDPEFRAHCDPRLVLGWEELIAQHDALGPLLVPEEDESDLPDPTPETTPQDVEEVVSEIVEVLEEAQAEGVVGEALVASTRSANRFARAGRTTGRYLKTALLTAGGIAAKIVGEFGKGAVGAAGGAAFAWWSTSPAGRALVEKLGPLVQQVLSMFGFK
ncbi:hypothetical protein JANAI62_07030 [Jannaschia pagri]|uniref:Leucine Rich repeat-containing protein n=1 Tax=Jannaschia pagri TaxID=2829797 RepID=A0ABQ4NIM4_9RHOB|nr:MULTISPECIES: leucine-rich repeat domain-containing protein [unclassified Jannaschia]GIT89813.1 hypothetical protein JANAI61_02710 [Jannaschia sp. AI_61]GIT94080.1 hypothetical protein JANAI62_07030 [Jannaschia sp. AI_62]